MDYPKSVASVGLVNGKFIDENPLTGMPGSLIPAAWGNAVTEELLGVIKGAGVAPDEVDFGQLLLAVRKINQAGLVDYALDTGTANAYSANYKPVLLELVDGLVLRFKAVHANTGASTFAPNGMAAKPIVGVDHNAVQDGEITAGGDVWVQWNSSIAEGAWVMVASTGMIKQTGSDIGDIKTVATAEPPKGWLKCNGDIVSRTQYAALFAAIGTRFGAGNGNTTFALPDLRGEFVRGWDDSRGIDSARELGSAQGGQNASHTHTATTAAAGTHTHGASTGGAGTHTHSGTTNNAGDHQHGVLANGNNTSYGRQGTGSGPGDYAAVTAAAGNHAHGLAINAVGDHVHAVAVAAVGDHAHTVTVAAVGGNESRPRNVALLYVIKY
ncbi:microcystin-dependent protein [Pseudomonas sp. GGS8]|uniref:tail fiber protein n=1 Tax=Pseudomonas sp. GGS8 TaxID=2817892 RepID=UPI0020A12936|nr:tail fiber protein [Pseudomonas sp. GGS8]MCP1443744.1 microcystin-dependent protein [Pseudomonas sp. GGS8]